MNCKSCNTRTPGGATNCPNCGLACSTKLPANSAEERKGPSPLSPSTAHEEIDLDEVAAPDRPKPVAPSESRAESKSIAPSQPKSDFGTAPKPSELRSMLPGQLKMLEPGLSVFKRHGKAVGENFETDLGRIDVLASDDGGGLVVIMIADSDAKDIVTDMLGRIGWVRKRVCATGQEVRGIVIAESIPESAQYMAAAVADTITFKTYKITLSFDTLEL